MRRIYLVTITMLFYTIFQLSCLSQVYSMSNIESQVQAIKNIENVLNHVRWDLEIRTYLSADSIIIRDSPTTATILVRYKNLFDVDDNTGVKIPREVIVKAAIDGDRGLPYYSEYLKCELIRRGDSWIFLHNLIQPQFNQKKSETKNVLYESNGKLLKTSTLGIFKHENQEFDSGYWSVNFPTYWIGLLKESNFSQFTTESLVVENGNGALKYYKDFHAEVPYRKEFIIDSQYNCILEYNYWLGPNREVHRQNVCYENHILVHDAYLPTKIIVKNLYSPQIEEGISIEKIFTNIQYE